MRIGDLIRKIGKTVEQLPNQRLHRLQRKYEAYTMIPRLTYVRNLALVKQFRHIPGAVVECGVWKGGMSAGMAEVAGLGRRYYLFDSFEGCPKAKALDGEKAQSWQQNTNSPTYYNNSSADMGFCQEAMRRAGAARCTVIKGWFEHTLPITAIEDGIAILRLDGDWYDSTMTCLELLFPKVSEGGVVIIDDYYAFEGCGRAVHDYLSRNQLGLPIRQLDNDVCYLVKRRFD